MNSKYPRLFEAWNKEKRSPDIQDLPEDFFNEMNSYLDNLNEQARILGKEVIKGRITVKESENAEQMLKEIFQLRLRKIVCSELNREVINGTALTPEEKRFYVGLRQLFYEFSERIKIMPDEDLSLREQEIREKGFKVVRFLENLPAIIGIDMKTYGPFKPEDVAAIPIQNAENLIRRGIAKEVESPK